MSRPLRFDRPSTHRDARRPAHPPAHLVPLMHGGAARSGAFRFSARDTGVTWRRQVPTGLIGCDEDCKKEEEDGGTMIGVDVTGDSTEDLTVVYRNVNSSVVGAGGEWRIPDFGDV